MEYCFESSCPPGWRAIEPICLIVVSKAPRALRPIRFGCVLQERLRHLRVERRSTENILYAKLADVRNKPNRQGHESMPRERQYHDLGKDASHNSSRSYESRGGLCKGKP